MQQLGSQPPSLQQAEAQQGCPPPPPELPPVVVPPSKEAPPSDPPLDAPPPSVTSQRKPLAALQERPLQQGAVIEQAFPCSPQHAPTWQSELKAQQSVGEAHFWPALLHTHEPAEQLPSQQSDDVLQ